ncbi:hypothetical protein [Photobacterium profundum]|nr:hypothetical protein [Photobacterium profundum]
MPFLFWPLFAGSIGFAGGLFSGEAFSRTLKILLFVVMGLWLVNITGVIK